MIVAAVHLLPYSLALQLYRVLNRIFKTMKPEYNTRTYFGARMLCRTDDIIQSRILHFGVWEPEISRIIEAILSPGDVFVDIGANIGYDTLLGSWRVGPAGKVVAIEALPSTFALLQRNLALNESASNVRAVQLAVSDRAGALDLYNVEDHNIGATSTLALRGTRHVGTATAAALVDILHAEELSRVRLIKIDIEGSEPAVLRNILDNLDLFPATTDFLVEVSPRDDETGWRKIYNRLKYNGYRGYEVPNLYDLRWYLGHRKTAPLRACDTLPSHQQDILFTRGKPPT